MRTLRLAVAGAAHRVAVRAGVDDPVHVEVCPRQGTGGGECTEEQIGVVRRLEAAARTEVVDLGDAAPALHAKVDLREALGEPCGVSGQALESTRERGEGWRIAAGAQRKNLGTPMRGSTERARRGCAATGRARAAVHGAGGPIHESIDVATAISATMALRRPR